MAGQDELADRFEDHRAHLRAVAHRMLGSLAEPRTPSGGLVPLSRAEPPRSATSGAG